MEQTIRVITTTDALYQEERRLRNEVLLRPIGLPDGAWEMHDESSTHIVLLEGERLVGCVLLREAGKGRGQLFQMAVVPDRQRRGLGKRLVLALLEEARRAHFLEVFCHARDDAIPFYERMAFRVSGAPFIEVGIGHHPMSTTVVQNDRGPNSFEAP